MSLQQLILHEVSTPAETKWYEICPIDHVVPGTGVAALVQGEQIAIVLGNLLANAIRHSHDGGTVRLHSHAQNGEHVFTVEDQGEGISPENLPHIFERHWSGAEPSTLKGRHGLGLAIAQEIAARHGGQLEVVSEVGKGTTFRLRLPRTHHAEASGRS